MTSTGSCSRMVSAAAMSVPSSIVPAGVEGERRPGSGRVRGRREDSPARVDRRLQLQDVLDRLDDQQVDAAVQQAAELVEEDVGELAAGVLAEHGVFGGGEQPGRADAAGDEAVLAGGVAGEAGRGEVDLVGAVAETPLRELEAAGLERVGLEDLGAGGDHRGVDVADDVGAAEVEHLVGAAGQGVVVLEREVERLERGAHAAVEDDDAVAGGLEEVPGHGGGR